MSTTHRRRLKLSLLLLGAVAVASALILYAFKNNINLFYTPTQCVEQQVPKHKTVRVGGMVIKGSVERSNDLQVAFVVTDYKQQVKIHYKGILPDLFREGQGIVAQGQFDENNQFIASQVLAKHDEKYMPPEVAASLAQQETTS